MFDTDSSTLLVNIRVLLQKNSKEMNNSLISEKKRENQMTCVTAGETFGKRNVVICCHKLSVVSTLSF